MDVEPPDRNVLQRQCCAVLLAAVLLGGCTPGAEEGGGVSAPTRTMRTHCIGRYLIDLPASFRLGHRGSSATLYFGRGEDFETVEFQLAGERVAPERFEADTKARSAAIAAERNERTKGPMLLSQERVGPDSLLLRYHKSALSNRALIHEVHALVSGAQILLRAESYEGRYVPVEARLRQLLSRLRPVSDPQRAGAGFCLGPVVLDAGNDDEVAVLHFRSDDPKHRDLRIGIDISTFRQDEHEPRLIRRASANLAAAGAKLEVLRKGKTRLAGMPAEEWGARRSNHGRVEHVFSIESYPAATSLGSPVLQLQMETGGALPPARIPSGLMPYEPWKEATITDTAEVGSSLSDTETTRLWKAIVETARAHGRTPSHATP